MIRGQMKKLVISGSSKLQKEFLKCVKYFKDKYDVVDYPVPIIGDFEKGYPDAHIDFYKKLSQADALLLLNMDKGEVKGYIGPSAFGELCIGIYLNVVEKRGLNIYIYQLPDKNVSCYDEIVRFVKLGWIKVFDKKIV